MTHAFWETTHAHAIRKVVMHPDVKPFLFLEDVNSYASINLQELKNKSITVYQLRVDNKLAGIVFFKAVGRSANIDAAFLPEFRGKNAKKFANELFNSYIQKTKIKFFTAKIRVTNKRSLVFARWCGFKVDCKDSDYVYVSKHHG